MHERPTTPPAVAISQQGLVAGSCGTKRGGRAGFPAPFPLLALILAATAGAATPALAAPVAVGLWTGWAAFRDDRIGRCHAVARPVDDQGRRKRDGSFLLGWWPGQNRRAEVSARPSRPAAPGRSATLDIGGSRFVLPVSGGIARAADVRSDRAILAAMRGARSMSISFVGTSGGRLTDSYPLRGAASAIDAAALACLSGR